MYNINVLFKKGFDIMKKIIILVITLINVAAYSAFAADFDWAEEAVDYCIENEILHGMENGDLALGENITNEQTAKILVSTFLQSELSKKQSKSEVVNESNEEEQNEKGSEDSKEENEDLKNLPVSDIDPERWSAKYVDIFNNYTKKKLSNDDLEIFSTREEFVSALVLASGLTERNIRNRNILDENFEDYKDVSATYKTLICIAVERGYMLGSDGVLNPKQNITRAEACSLIYRVIRAAKNGETLDLGVRFSETKMLAPTQITPEQAKQWAKNRGAAQIFIDAADFYWEYGEITGICPEILYAQAAKETKFGLYGGAVLPEQNNWAGIKVAHSNGDATEDHETFETPEDGVRGHFNHMGAYVGIEPVGEPHGRYFSVSKMKWAGEVKTLEELGGKWCPDLYYGYSILHNFLTPMLNTEVEE